MKGIVTKIVFVVVVLGALILIPRFNIHNGLNYLEQVHKAYKNSQASAQESVNSQNTLDETVKSLHDARPSGTPNLDNPNELYNAIKKLPGVVAIQADAIKFDNQGRYTVLGELNPNEQNMNLQGVQFSVQVKDLQPFLDALGKLDTPYQSLNVVTVQKEVIIRYNTQGGVS